MGWAQSPTDGELRAFLRNLHAWRSTLSEGERRLVDSMAAAALGQTAEPRVGELQLFGDACAEDAPGGDRTGREDARQYAARWLATPWGMTYTASYW